MNNVQQGPGPVPKWSRIRVGFLREYCGGKLGLHNDYYHLIIYQTHPHKQMRCPLKIPLPWWRSQCKCGYCERKRRDLGGGDGG